MNSVIVVSLLAAAGLAVVHLLSGKLRSSSLQVTALGLFVRGVLLAGRDDAVHL